MKTFYTVRDIEDMHAAGVVEIETHDDVVVTDVAREKAIALGMRLKPLEPDRDPASGTGAPRLNLGPGTAITPAGRVVSDPPTPPAPPSPALPRISQAAASADPVRQIKAAVVARLGTDKYNHLLDRIIPQVMAQLKDREKK